eukprot:2152627-Rhodomonas_salina.1
MQGLRELRHGWNESESSQLAGAAEIVVRAALRHLAGLGAQRTAMSAADPYPKKRERRSEIERMHDWEKSGSELDKRQQRAQRWACVVVLTIVLTKDALMALHSHPQSSSTCNSSGHLHAPTFSAQARTAGLI